MSISPELRAYIEGQDVVFEKFAAKQANLPETGVTIDKPGTEPQSAFLVGWRFGRGVAEGIAGFSLTLNGVGKHVLYGHNKPLELDNAHVTLTDHQLTKGEVSVMDMDPSAAEATLVGLALAVGRGIQRAGTRDFRDARLDMGGALHNGTTAVLAGAPNQALFNVRSGVLDAINTDPEVRDLMGLKDDDKPKNGAWGAHSTVGRALEPIAPGTPGIRMLMNVLAAAPQFGEVQPESLDVAHFVTTPDGRFDLRVYESFGLPKVA